MINQSPDTPFEVEKKQIELIRRSSIAERISLVRSLSQTTMNLSRRAIKRSMPDKNDKEIDFAFVALHYGEKIANSLRSYMEAIGR